MNQAVALYESIKGVLGIRQLVADRTKEGIYIEFKEKKNRSVSALDDSDAWQFSRALSGFANSDGGVIVWGIATDNERAGSEIEAHQYYCGLRRSIKKVVAQLGTTIRGWHPDGIHR